MPRHVPGRENLMVPPDSSGRAPWAYVGKRRAKQTIPQLHGAGLTALQQPARGLARIRVW